MTTTTTSTDGALIPRDDPQAVAVCRTMARMADRARDMPSAVLYVMGQAGMVAAEVLDERLIRWTEEGWSQRRIAEELGCDHSSVSRRQKRLGITAAGPQAGKTAPNVAQRNIGPSVPPPDIEGSETEASLLRGSAERASTAAKRICGFDFDRAAAACTADELDAVVKAYEDCGAAYGEALKTLKAYRKHKRAAERAEAKRIKGEIAVVRKQLVRRYELPLEDAQKEVAHEANRRDGLGFAKDVKTVAQLERRLQTLCEMEMGDEVPDFGPDAGHPGGHAPASGCPHGFRGAPGSSCPACGARVEGAGREEVES